MRKPAILFVLAICAVLAAGVFGALHNQLSYSVGSSYFHDLKFSQFGITESWQNRVGASMVGWLASWWMGLVVGLPAFLLGYFLIRHPQRFLVAGFSAIGAVIFVVMLFTMGGLVLGMLAPSVAADLPLPEGVRNSDSFLRAAMMHGASYIGGIVGILVAMFTVWQAYRAERNARRVFA